ncbi:Crp/Fnr family transcriptional regulator [Streptomyces sp. UNOB3_S3]|uniref:Crp/Fnr family transcriptional regulator n=1 Tax=Streptomyces sp. UNOB3_S3 TaxID=2871682 RepID=UPI001E2A7212|nr:Crp/Fnr family transcriptional regulator [Streptomyces sp. UNOB3_S3]MCC3779370.1 Crp/Fnr family transcriptional regulator [Streptomyces sp. UNOB3_S3]
MGGQGAARTTFWSLLDDADRVELLKAGQPHHYPRDEVIFRQNDLSDYLLIVRKGCVKVVVHSAEGYDTILALRGPGDLLGEQAGLDGLPRSATVACLTDVRALVIPLDRFSVVVRARHSVSRALQHTLSDRLREADRHRAATGAAGVRCRLAALLLELSEEYGVRTDLGEIRIALPLSQDDLASLLLSSRRTVSRVFEQWRFCGWVLTGRRTILIRHVDALKSHVAEGGGGKR